jgi:small GTP-binding protein
MAAVSANAAVVLTPRPAAHAGAAIAVVRIRGPAVGEFLRRFFSRPACPARCVHGQLRDGTKIIDDPVILLSPDESWADICLHGGPWIISTVLELARREGFAIAPDSAPPLPDVALDGDLPLLEREMLAHLPLARTEPAIRVLLQQPVAWRVANTEQLNLRAIVNDETLWRLLHIPQVAIVGAPNVGKSTLANRLFGQERSITADLPGTTRDWVGEIADIGGLAVMLVDTPGQRDTADEIEHAAIAASGEKIRGSDLILQVLDATRPPAARPDSPGSLIVINKIDQPPAWDFKQVKATRISARDGTGLPELSARIHRFFGVNLSDEPRPLWWTHRQRDILNRALQAPRLIHELGTE